MQSTSNPKIILLVEDNPKDEMLTLRAFVKQNLQDRVVVVRDGQEALDFLFAHGAYQDRNPQQMPDLVLLDLKLPKLSGLQVLQKIRSAEATRLLPVVVLTSSNDDKDIVESYNLGANSYVRKPVDFNALAEAIRHLGFYWLTLNTPPPLSRSA